MKNLIEEMAVFVDMVDMFTKKVNDIEQINIRDANRIAKLEREITVLDNSYHVDRDSQKIENDRLTNLTNELRMRTRVLESKLNEGGIDIDGDESLIERIDNLECVVEDKVDRDEVEDMIERNDIDDLIIDAVRNEIDAIDFKVTVER
jgi:hypothetical protein